MAAHQFLESSNLPKIIVINYTDTRKHLTTSWAHQHLTSHILTSQQEATLHSYHSLGLVPY